MYLLLLTPLLVSSCGEVFSQPGHNILFRSGGTQRIIGGVKAKEGSWPWQVVIQYRDYVDGGEYLCGGSVISKRHILTAAHCSITMNMKQTTIYLGTSSRIPKPGEAVLVHPTKKDVHPHYSSNERENPSQEHDLAVLTFSPEITFSNRIRPICLPGSNFALEDFGYVTGYGLYNKGSQVIPRPNDFLLQSILPIVDFENCLNKWMYDLVDYGGGIPINNRTQICAGAVGHGSAQGDSGGPFVQRSSDGKWYQVGIVSFGINYGKGYLDQALAPGIYTRVSAYCDWINETTKGEANCKEETANIASEWMSLFLILPILLVE